MTATSLLHRWGYGTAHEPIRPCFPRQVCLPPPGSMMDCARLSTTWVGPPLRRRIGLCRAPGLATPLCALDFGFSHQPLHSALADLLSFALQGDRHAPVAVGAVVALVDLADAGEQPLVLDRPGRSPALGALVVGGGRHLQGAADRLDPEALAVLLDEGAHFVRRGSSSSTANAGRPGSSSPTRSTTTLSSSTTPGAVTRRSGCSAPPNTRIYTTRPNRPPDSRTATPSKQG